MNHMGHCRDCGDPAVVQLNRIPRCQKHYELELDRLVAALTKGLANAGLIRTTEP